MRALEAEERRVSSARLASVRLRDERERMVRARLLSAWAIISTPLILLLVASLILPAS